MDMRVYNGCPNDELMSYLEHVASMEEALLELCPEAQATYFPMEECWKVHKCGIGLSGMHFSKLDALEEAIANLKEKTT